MQILVNGLTTASAASKQLDWVAPLLMRFILAPVMIVAGYNKLNLGNVDVQWWQRILADENVVAWFGNSEWGLGLPLPDVLAFMAGWTEFAGGWLLLIGFATRLISIPLAVTMVVAAVTVHWDNGWFAIAPTNPATSAALALDWLGIPGAAESLQNSVEAADRLQRIRGLVSEHGFPDYLYGTGPIAILNNGIEFAAIYFVMLVNLIVNGAGRFVSLDYWLFRHRFNG